MPKQQNGDEPATQRDLATWGGRLTERIDGLDSRMDKVESELGQVKSELGQVHRAVEATLTTVQSIDAKLNETADHEERITRLENRAFRSPTRQ